MSAPTTVHTENQIFRARRTGTTAYGISIKSPSARSVQAAARAGMQFVRFDLGAGSVPLDTLDALVASALASGLTPLARVNTSEHLEPAFSSGVQGVTLPHVEDAKQAAALADRCHVLGAHLGPELLVSVQVESVSALRDLDAIAAVAQVHMLQSGRNDLAASMGLPGPADHPDVLAAEEQIAAAARQHDKLVSLHFAPGPHSLEQARTWVARGIHALTLGADTQILEDAVAHRLGQVRPGVKTLHP